MNEIIVEKDEKQKKNDKPTILYVDDELNNLSTFKAAFRRYYNILTASKAMDALEILRNNQVDLIITDQRMPEMTGVQFLEAVIPEYPGPTRMILTGFSDIEAIMKAVNTGAVLRYITKPWNEVELKQIIDMGFKFQELDKSKKLLLQGLEDKLANQKKAIELFEKYTTDKTLIKQALQSDQEDLVSEGEYRIVTSLFSDIRSFTTLSSGLDPKELVTYLNQYFSIMVDCVVKNHGAVYRLVGDGLWAIFGWPVSTLQNQLNAVQCALDMIKALDEFNNLTSKKLHHTTTIGIGISTGEAVVGQIQSEHFTSSVVIGESIDVAASIEDLTRGLSNTILITDATYQAVKNHIEVESQPPVTIEGKAYQFYKVIKKKS